MKKWMIELRLKTHKKSKKKLENKENKTIVDNLRIADYQARIKELEWVLEKWEKNNG